jgi:hypothetical protein
VNAHLYDLSGVTFVTPGGTAEGTATGTFTTNDARTALVTFDITTSTVGGFPGFEYTPATAPIVGTDVMPFALGLGNGTHALILEFNGGLTATGATTLGGSFEINNNASPTERFVASGSVVAVPEPSSLLLGGVAVGVLTVVAYAGRKRSRARA